MTIKIGDVIRIGIKYNLYGNGFYEIINVETIDSEKGIERITFARIDEHNNKETVIMKATPLWKDEYMKTRLAIKAKRYIDGYELKPE